MSKRLLFLDDDEARHARFRGMTIGLVVDHVRSVSEALHALRNHDAYDVAFFDHDLDWKATAGLTPLSPTGTDLARELKFIPPNRIPRRVVIHSLNPVGSMAMLDLIEKLRIPVKRIPFGNRLLDALT